MLKFIIIDIGYEIKSTISTNSNRNYWNGCKYGEHAEMSAIKKNIYKRKNNVHIMNLIVIRINNNCELKKSKPCTRCIKHLLKNKYIKIKYVFYSINGGFVKVKFNTLINDNDLYVSSRFK